MSSERVLYPACSPEGPLKVILTHQRGFTEKLGTTDQIADGHVEVGVTGAPVGDLGEWISCQWLLKNKTINTGFIRLLTKYMCNIDLCMYKTTVKIDHCVIRTE